MQEVIKALQILDSIDQVRWPRIPYDTLFQSAGFPFQKSWLEQKGFGGGFSGQAPVNTGSSEFNLDSLKTHPDCPQRIELTKKQLEKMPQKEGSTFLQAESWFKTLQQSTPYEMVEGLYDRGYYGRSLFRTLVLLCNKREDVYLNTMVIKNLYEICQFQRSHRLRYVVDQPDREYSAEYNRFLKFINQFRVSDLEQMTFHFYHERKDNYPDSEDFAFATVLACSLKGLGPEFDTSLEHYLHTYPNGKYLDALKDLKH
jgi:hypothetical protein